MEKVISEILFDEVTLIATANNKFIYAIM